MVLRYRYVVSAVVCLLAMLITGVAWCMDEAILTPTGTSIVPAEEKSFNDAFGVWLGHRYSDGEKLLREFSTNNPNSRWAAEADLHVGCYLTFKGQYGEARTVFERLVNRHRGNNVSAKATLRLGNVAEREGKVDEAITRYSSVLRRNPTWDQFKYANYNARKLMMTRNKRLAAINCGPVALAACLDDLGMTGEAMDARDIPPSTDGISLAALQAHAETLGAQVQAVEMSIKDLKGALLPVLAYVQPNHYVAVLGTYDGGVEVEDSIRGRHTMSWNALEKAWGGRALAFVPDPSLKPLSMVASIETLGGCCGQADEDECLGDCPEECDQTFTGGDCGFGDGDTPRWGDIYVGGGDCVDRITNPQSAGRPTWRVNTVNLNILVKDTPIWYNPGKGPGITFTLTYSNENSNTGVFGRGWRSQYDMKVFFLPGYDNDHPDLQVHLDNGRVETYEYNGTAYEPESGMASYGYRDEIKILNSTEAAAESRTGSTVDEGSVRITRRRGGKCFFKSAVTGATVEGRVYIIEDAVGDRVTCGYTSGRLSSVTDANGNVTTITTQGTGINERVTEIELPTGDERTAQFSYTDGNLTSITDMVGDTSTLSYNALLPYYGTSQFSAATTTTQEVTTSDPATSNGTLSVDSTTGFLSNGKIKVNYDEEMTYTSMTASTFTGITRTDPKAAYDGAYVEQAAPETDLDDDITESSPATGGDLNVVSTAGFPSSGYIAVEGENGTETINYTGKTSTAFTGITRGDPAYDAAAATSDIWLCVQTPYLSEIVTPSKKTRFDYEWVGNGTTGPIIGLHEIRECGPTETSYPAVATIHYAWCGSYSYQTQVTRYPTSVTAGGNGCYNHWTGGLTKVYYFYAFYDATSNIQDELGNVVTTYAYNYDRDRTSVTDVNGNTTTFEYGDDHQHNMYSRTDPLTNTWHYTYDSSYRAETEQDPEGNYVKRYTYNSAGQVTKVEGQLSPGTWSTLAESGYDSGRLSWSKDGSGNQTDYHYGESETRGFLTSVHAPGSNTTVYTYDDKGRKHTVTDALSHTSTFDYDNLDRVTTVTNPDSTTVQTEYTCCHKVKTTDENGRVARYEYDLKGRPWATISAAIDGTLYSGLDAGATTLVLTDASSFSSGGGSIFVARADGTGGEMMTYTGKSSNSLTGVARGRFGSTAISFTAGDRVTVGNIVAMVYHSTYLDWKTGLYDANEHLTQYEYLDNGRLSKMTYPDGTWEKYTYGQPYHSPTNLGSGNLTKKEYGHSTTTTKTIHYVYDANNRLTDEWGE